MKAQAKEERARKLAERDRLEREKQARLEAERRQMELEERLQQMEDEIRKAIHARLQTEETLKMMQEQVPYDSTVALCIHSNNQSLTKTMCILCWISKGPTNDLHTASVLCYLCVTR